MSALRRLQEDFQRYVLARAGSVAQEIVDDAILGAGARLEIYADAYRLRLLEALETDFTALHAFLGDETFEALGRAYIECHASTHFSLRHYGRQMAAFLRTTPPYRENTLLSELAAFDWALTTAFDAADSSVVAVEEVAAVPAGEWPRLAFAPHPSVIRLDLKWNAPAIWKAADSKQTLPAPERAAHPIGWVVWRQNLQTYFRSLSVDEAFALDAMLRGETFAAICEGLCEWIDPHNVPTHAAGLLRRWIEDGMIQKIDARYKIRDAGKE